MAHATQSVADHFATRFSELCPRKSDLSSKTFVLAEPFFFFVESLGLCVRPMLLRSPTPRRGQRSKNVFITQRKQPIKKVAAPSPQLSVDVDLCAALGVSQSRDHTWLLAGATGSDIRASPRCGSRVPVTTTPTEHAKRKAGCHHRCSVLTYLIGQLRQYINWCPLGDSIALSFSFYACI